MTHKIGTRNGRVWFCQGWSAFVCNHPLVPRAALRSHGIGVPWLLGGGRTKILLARQLSSKLYALLLCLSHFVPTRY